MEHNKKDENYIKDKANKISKFSNKNEPNIKKEFTDKIVLNEKKESNKKISWIKKIEISKSIKSNTNIKSNIDIKSNKNITSNIDIKSDKDIKSNNDINRSKNMKDNKKIDINKNDQDNKKIEIISKNECYKQYEIYDKTDIVKGKISVDQTVVNDEIIENKENSTAALFVKVGIVVLSILMIVGFGIKVLPGAVTVSSRGSKWDLPISSVETDKKEIALSFDTAMENDDTLKILAILTKYNIKATFFITGEWIEKYPGDLKKIVAAGNNLGNHSESHVQMAQLTKEQCTDEIMKVHKKVKKLTGVEMNLFRVPYGDYNDMLVGIARDCGYYTIQWDVDSEDWKDYGTNSIIKSVVDNKNLGNGSIILMHDGAKYTPEALEEVIISLQEKGYEIVPVSELIYTRPYTVDHEGRQFAK